MKYLIATALAATIILIPTSAQADLPTRPCKQEDSRSCVWDAKHMGNGQGRSFWTGKGGQVHYISHAKAHRLIFG